MLFIDSEVVFFSSSSDVGFDNGKVCWKIFSLCMSHDFLLKKKKKLLLSSMKAYMIYEKNLAIAFFCLSRRNLMLCLASCNPFWIAASLGSNSRASSRIF